MSRGADGFNSGFGATCGGCVGAFLAVCLALFCVVLMGFGVLLWFAHASAEAAKEIDKAVKKAEAEMKAQEEAGQLGQRNGN